MSERKSDSGDRASLKNSPTFAMLSIGVGENRVDLNKAIETSVLDIRKKNVVEKLP